MNVESKIQDKENDLAELGSPVDAACSLGIIAEAFESFHHSFQLPFLSRNDNAKHLKDAQSDTEEEIEENNRCNSGQGHVKYKGKGKKRANKHGR